MNVEDFREFRLNLTYTTESTPFYETTLSGNFVDSQIKHKYRSNRHRKVLRALIATITLPQN